MLKTITINQTTLNVPTFLPDATLGVARNLDSFDLRQAGIKAVMVNSYHLKDRPGVKILETIPRQIKQLMNWSGLVASDSGGFQLFSLIQKNPKLGKITDQGIVLYNGPKQNKKTIFSPEKSIQTQFALGSDLMICLDDFTPADASPERLKQSVKRTIAWSKRSKQEFLKQLAKKGLKWQDQNRPQLLAAIQGHRNQKLRAACAQSLVKIGFDAYGLGGWPFKPNGQFDYELCQFNAQLTPADQPKFALGIGKPENIAALAKMGYDFFDCVLPTRDARHQRLYAFTQDPTEIFAKYPLKTSYEQTPPWYEFIYINRGKYQTDLNPINSYCQCHTCQHYSRAYLNHLFKIKDGLAFRLATIHNLSFFATLIKSLQQY